MSCLNDPRDKKNAFYVEKKLKVSERDRRSKNKILKPQHKSNVTKQHHKVYLFKTYMGVGCE